MLPSSPTRRRGFTLIELLLVVTIIGVLATLAVQRFAAVKNRAYYAAMRNDLRNLYTQMELDYETRNTYTAFTHTANTTATNSVNLQPSSDVTITVATVAAATNAPPGYTATARHTKLGTSEGCNYAVGATYAASLQIITCTTPTN